MIVATAQQLEGALHASPSSSLSEEAVAELTATVRRGTPWRQALREVARSPAERQRAGRLTDDSRGNWMWFVDLARWEHALDVQGGVGTLTAALARHFTSVQYVDAARSFVEFARARFAQDGSTNVAVTQALPSKVPYRDAVFDCVIWDGALARRVTTAAPAADASSALQAVFDECHRVVRPGGCLYVGIAATTWRLRTTQSRGRLNRLIMAHALPRLLRGAGFRRVRTFYVSPSFQEPWNIIPARRPAVLVYETLHTTGSSLRIWLAWLGFHALLYDCHLFLAYR